MDLDTHSDAAPRPSEVTISWVEAGSRQDAAAVWRELEAAGGCPSVTTSWPWTEVWLRHYGDVVRHRFAVGWRGDTVVGIAMVTRGVEQRYGRLPVRSLHLGTAGEPPGHGVHTEYNGLVALPERRAAFAAALVSALCVHSRADQIELDGFTVAAAKPLLASARFVEQRADSPYMDLDKARSAGGEVLGALSSSVRRRLRQSLRALPGASGSWAEGKVESLAVLDELVDLHGRRWRRAGEHGAFASERFLAFHRDLISVLAPRGQVALFRLHGPDATLACLYALVDGDRLLFYQSGVAAMDDNRCRPGLVGHLLFMQAALERGYREYDFLAGEGRYKRELSTGSHELVWAILRRRRARFAAGGLLRLAAASSLGQRLRAARVAATPLSAPSTPPRHSGPRRPWTSAS